jgi:hypothetical protein
MSRGNLRITWGLRNSSYEGPFNHGLRNRKNTSGIEKKKVERTREIYTLECDFYVGTTTGSGAKRAKDVGRVRNGLRVARQNQVFATRVPFCDQSSFLADVR